MSTFLQVNPEHFIDTENHLPANGRGAWSKAGIELSNTYELFDTPLGSQCEKSLAHWTVGAGIFAIQTRLTELDIKGGTTPSQAGVYNQNTARAVLNFQRRQGLVEDGVVGIQTAHDLFKPLAEKAQTNFLVPRNYLVGLVQHESVFDPAAAGFFIYYGDDFDYRGVDRGFAQINSKAHPDIGWKQSYEAMFSMNYAAKRMRDTWRNLGNRFDQPPVTLWMAAICSHNSPVNGEEWARLGEAPNAQAAKYVESVLDARF